MILRHLPGIQPIRSTVQGLLPERLASQGDVGAMGGWVLSFSFIENQWFEANPPAQIQLSNCRLLCFTPDGDKVPGI